MNGVGDVLNNMFWNLTHRLGVADIIDILIVAVIIYELLVLTRRTRGSALIKGLVVLLVIVALSSILRLTSLSWLLMQVLKNGALVLVILFQPELRKALEKIGRSSFLNKNSKSKDMNDEVETEIAEITQTMVDLSRRRVGALIVIERKTGLQDVIETGTRLDAAISAPLLENIFEPNTPLHDGAVVIRDRQIMAAACILPLTEASGVSRELGTRHRAGIGLSENSDAIVLIVSEETGIMSLARGGQLTRPLTVDALRNVLRGVFVSEPSRIGAFLRSIAGNGKRTEHE